MNRCIYVRKVEWHLDKHMSGDLGDLPWQNVTDVGDLPWQNVTDVSQNVTDVSQKGEIQRALYSTIYNAECCGWMMNPDQLSY